MVALQPVSPENYPDLLKVLEKFLPDSIVPYYWMMTQIRWAEKIPSLKITILCPDGDCRDGAMVALGEGLVVPDKIHSVIYSPENYNNDIFKEALISSQLIDWDRLKYFSGAHERLNLMLAEILKAKGFQHTHKSFHQCYFLHMSAEDAANAPLPDLPPNVRVGPLEVSHLDIMCKNWIFYGPDYRPVAEKMIELNPSFAVFVKNGSGEEELGAMVVQSEYGAVGLLQTVPEHRRKGYASIALAHLTRALGKSGTVPHAHIAQKNTASSKLFEKHGYKIHGASSWVLFNKLQEN